jgi:hypothetical protein
MPYCKFPVFLLFCVLEKLHRKYSQNWMKQKPKFLFSLTRDGVQSRDGGGPEGGHAMPCHRPPPGCTMVWALGPPLYIALPPIYSPRQENTKGPNSFPKNILQATAIVDPRLGGSRSSSRHPAGEGNHHWRPSSLPCLPPEWCVSSLP